MKVLHIASGFPSSDKLFYQPFIKTQIDSLRREGINCTTYEIKSHKSKLEYFKSIGVIRDLIKTENYDLIHAHYSYCGFTAYFSAGDKPIILSLMGSDLLGTPNTKGDLTIRGRIDKFISSSVARKMNHLIVKSEQMKKNLNVHVPITVIPNGVDFNIFRPLDKNKARENLGFNENDFLVLFLGNPKQSVKNFNLMLKVFESFKKENDNINLITPYGISQQQVVKYMNAADVLLVTSFWEGSPNVIKEAMACNLPIISTDVGDVKDVMKNAYNCFIVDYSEVEILDKLKIIYSNRERTDGRSKIDHLRIEFIAKKIIDLYESVLNNRNN